jgi:hypothetical protein
MGKFRDLNFQNVKVALMADPDDVLIFVKVRQILERPKASCRACGPELHDCVMLNASNSETVSCIEPVH